MTAGAFDCIVVGAGSAGCVVAGRLSEDPDRSVLLLEAGKRVKSLSTRIPVLTYRTQRTALNWDHLTEPQDYLDAKRLHWPRGRGVGGTSLLNAQVYLRAHPGDFARWAQAGLTGWSWEEVVPYYRRVEGDRRHKPSGGSTGPIDIADQRDPNPMTAAFLEGAAELGFRTNPDLVADLSGAGLMAVTQRRGARWSAADAYLGPALTRPNLRLVTGASVTRVRLQGDRALGVEYLHGGSQHFAATTGEVILSGGAIQSPQVLLLSGIGPARHLAGHGIRVTVDLPGVGDNLQDHFGTSVRYSCTSPISLTRAESPRRALQYAIRRRGPLTSNVVEATAFGAHAASGRPDLQLVFAPVGYAPWLLYSSPRRWITNRLRPAAARLAPERFADPSLHGFSIFSTVQHPQSRGTIELASSDPRHPPRIDPRCLSDHGGDDLRTVVDGIRLARELAKIEALDDYAAGEIEPGDEITSDAGLEAFVRAKGYTTNHAVGTCRMGDDPAAVVDSFLRVHGTANLRVADASIMPELPTGHPYATVLMIGERAADFVRHAGANRRPPVPTH